MESWKMKVYKTKTMSRYDGVVIETTAKDYPKDWPVITMLWNKFGGHRPTRYKFIIIASLSDVEKLL